MNFSPYTAAGSFCRDLYFKQMPVFLAGTFAFILAACSSGTNPQDKNPANDTVQLADDPNAPAPTDSLGVGPVKSVTLAALDISLAEQGKSIFEAKCSACHQLSGQRIVGPGLAGITSRRTPEWIMNMVINPEEMTRKDPKAKALLDEYGTQMVNQQITETDARALLEFFRQNDGVK